MSSRRTRWIRRRALAVAVAAVGVVAIAGTALAGHQTSSVKSYTGCLVSGDGVMVKIKVGDAPRSACTGGQVEAHFSGGDITKISVGGGLSLPNGGDDGEVRIELAAGQTLPAGCEDGHVAEWNVSAWVCGVDNDTTYSADTGLDLSTANAFSIEPSYRIAGKGCPSGSAARGFDSNGEIDCVSVVAPPVTVAQNQPNYQSGDGIPDDGVFYTYVDIALPSAGAYLVLAKGFIKSEQNIEENGAQAHCNLRKGGGFLLDSMRFVSDQLDDNAQTTFALSGIATLPGNVVQLACAAEDGADGLTLVNGRIVAVKVG